MNQHTRIRQSSNRNEVGRIGADTPTALVGLRPEPASSLGHTATIALREPAKTYDDYLADGRVWGAKKLAAARWKGSHDIESLARVYADINAPDAVRKAHFAALQAEQDAEFGASGFDVGFYGVHRLGAVK